MCWAAGMTQICATSATSCWVRFYCALIAYPAHPWVTWHVSQFSWWSLYDAEMWTCCAESHWDMVDVLVAPQLSNDPFRHLVALFYSGFGYMEGAHNDHGLFGYFFVCAWLVREWSCWAKALTGFCSHACVNSLASLRPCWCVPLHEYVVRTYPWVDIRMWSLRRLHIYTHVCMPLHFQQCSWLRTAQLQAKIRCYSTFTAVALWM